DRRWRARAEAPRQAGVPARALAARPSRATPSRADCRRDRLDREADLGPELAYFRRSWILASPAFAQFSSSPLPGHPAAPMAPTPSSPTLMTTPPPASRRRGSLAMPGPMGSVFSRSMSTEVSTFIVALV